MFQDKGLVTVSHVASTVHCSTTVDFFRRTTVLFPIELTARPLASAGVVCTKLLLPMRECSFYIKL